ncbi:hypothetical protein [Actinoplanes regularis]|uniref:Uncharacterized protein n=1 Tax=Actinoplanes regularis TaxID=52697 RepID=A0A239GNP9_9ACTN|nr:hypothetical protein [Actinoplanes regularis]GIE90696.1 hypothetical protein Are01nite_71760 [Actinoplanes regularis]SNS70398.1 hypothetical protein SAMN06264365_121109 [Actinoplanes regularis]
MSRIVSIDFSFSPFPDLLDIVDALRVGGVTLEQGEVCVVTTDGDHTWEDRNPTDLKTVMEEMQKTVSENQSVGFQVEWPADEESGKKGGTVLLMPQHNIFSFAPDMTTLPHGQDPCSVGLGWYLDRLGALLAPLHPTSMRAANEE